MEAICTVGNSTKTKAKGYIGEKGIGFKSVFKISNCPQIFSNGFRFDLPKEDVETTLGYIVPRWIDKPAFEIEDRLTTLVLPINKSIAPQRIVNELLGFAPETILFLQKLTEITIEIDALEQQTKIVIRKEHCSANLVHLTYRKEDENQEPVERISSYWMQRGVFSKPENIHEEKRDGITEREVSVAIPLDEKNIQDRIFAYLPVANDTGLPFLINADFLLVSSREGIHEDKEWNIWLRDSVSEVYCKAFLSCLKSEDVLPEQKYVIYRSIPTEAFGDFLEPIEENIHTTLREMEIVLTEPSLELRKPGECLFALPKFRYLLVGGQKYPSVLVSNPIVLKALEKTSPRLRAIGVRSMQDDVLQACFEDRNWLGQHDYDWLLDCYSYLQASKAELVLKKCPLVPISNEEDIVWSCEAEQPVYLLVQDNTDEIIRTTPKLLRVDIAFLSPIFYNKIKENVELLKWMKTSFGVSEFSSDTYLSDLFANFKANYEAFSFEDFLLATLFFAENQLSKSQLIDFPVQLSSGERKLLSEARKMDGVQAIATPENLDPETGWQNIFRTEKDREHLIWLAANYTELIEDSQRVSVQKLWERLLIFKHPPAKQVDDKYIWVARRQGYSHSYLKYDIRSSVTKNERIGIDTDLYPSGDCFLLTNSYPPKSISQCTDERLSKSLLNWLLNIGSQQLKATFSFSYYKSLHSPSFLSDLKSALQENAWLKTSQGYKRPNQTFLPLEGIRELLQDTVPYYEGEEVYYPILKEFGIKSQVTTETLVDLLKEQRQKITPSFFSIQRIYNIVQSRPEDKVRMFLFEECVFIPKTDEEWVWVKPSEAIWEDSSDMFGDDFVYLENVYPNLRTFFVDTVGVKKRANEESYAKQWLKIQNEPVTNVGQTQDKLRAIYNQLLPIINSIQDERPSWFASFLKEAKVFTQKNNFKKPCKAYISDDSELEELFTAKDVTFAWNTNKFSELYLELELYKLSETVKVSLSSASHGAKGSSAKYLTPSARILILSFLSELGSKIYKSTIEDLSFKKLLATEECEVTELILEIALPQYERVHGKNGEHVDFVLAPVIITKIGGSYWDKASSVLYIQNDKPNKLKNSIARTLSRSLTQKEPRKFKELARWIELVLGSKVVDWRLKQEQLSIPEEVQAFLEQPESFIENELDNKRGNEKDEVENSNSDEIAESIQEEEGEVSPTSENAETEASTSDDGNNNAPKRKTTANDRHSHENQKPVRPPKPDRTDLNNNNSEGNKGKPEFPQADVPNRDRRRQKTREKVRPSVKKQYSQSERSIRTTQNSVDPDTYLRSFYTNEDDQMVCQVCEEEMPFKKKDDNYYFESVEAFPREYLSRERQEQYLALCPVCAAKYREFVKTKDSEQAKLLFETLLANQEDLVFQLDFNTERATLQFVEKHFVDLKACMEVEEEEEDSSET